MCVAGCFMWQYVLLCLLGGNACWCMFHVAMCVVRSFRSQCVLLGLLYDNMYC